MEKIKINGILYNELEKLIKDKDITVENYIENLIKKSLIIEPYKEEYIDYMIDKISTLNLEHFDIVKENLLNIKVMDLPISIGKKLQPIHSHYYRDCGLDFLDYFNYKRCKDFNLPI